MGQPNDSAADGVAVPVEPNGVAQAGEAPAQMVAAGGERRPAAVGRPDGALLELGPGDRDGGLEVGSPAGRGQVPGPHLVDGGIGAATPYEAAPSIRKIQDFAAAPLTAAVVDLQVTTDLSSPSGAQEPARPGSSSSTCVGSSNKGRGGDWSKPANRA